MNKKQKILTGIAIVALAIVGLSMTDSGANTATWTALGFIAVAYIGIFFMLK